MTHCDFLESCPYLEEALSGAPSVIRSGYEKSYCRGEIDECARSRMAAVAGRDNVPDDLGPHEEERARSLLAEAGHTNVWPYF